MSDRLADIKAREQAAFGGPWEALDADENGMHAVAVDGTVLVEVGDFCDAEFIAHARDDIPHLLALVESLTAERDALVTTVGRVQALVDSNPDHADTCGSVLTPGAGYPCSCWQADLRAALAVTTGEGEHVAREVFTADGIPFVSCLCTNAKSPTRWLTDWLIRYDPDDGEPYGEVCDCEIGDDHYATGEGE